MYSFRFAVKHMNGYMQYCGYRRKASVLNPCTKCIDYTASYQLRKLENVVTYRNHTGHDQCQVVAGVADVALPLQVRASKRSAIRYLV